jgi:hypothetical protein
VGNKHGDVRLKYGLRLSFATAKREVLIMRWYFADVSYLMVVIVLICGWDKSNLRGDSLHKPNTNQQKEKGALQPTPNAEEARKALIRFVDEDLKKDLDNYANEDAVTALGFLVSATAKDSLRKDAVRFEQETGYTRIGAWTMKLNESTFFAAASTGSQLFVLNGVFELKGNKWDASFKSLGIGSIKKS